MQSLFECISPKGAVDRATTSDCPGGLISAEDLREGLSCNSGVEVWIPVGTVLLWCVQIDLI